MILLDKINHCLSENKIFDFIDIREATPEDSSEITSFFVSHPEVSFCTWQGEKETRDMIKNESSVVILAYAKNRLIGVSVGGVLGSRATINHLAVDSKYRKIGVANKILEYVLGNIKEKGVKRMFLFVDTKNKPGMSFWKKQGFSEIYSEITMEKDI